MEQVQYELPDSWSWKLLDDISEKITDGTHHSPKVQYSEWEAGRFKYITSKNIKNYGMKLHNISYIDQDVHDEIYARCAPELDDQLLTKDGAMTGTCCLNELDESFSLLSSVALIKQKRSIVLPKYLNYYLQSHVGQNFLLGDISGAAITRTNIKKLKSTPVPLAPMFEQKRIVEKLDALLTRIDTAIEHLQESVTLADALYASELNEFFPSDADVESLSNKTGWVSLSDICTFENGDRGKNYPSKSAFVAEGIPVVSAGNLGERYIDHKRLNYIKPERYELLRSGRIRIGDILFCLRGSLGKVAISKDIDQGVIASSLVIIRPKERVLAEYVYKYLKSSLCQQFITYYNNGAAQPNLSAKSLGKFMLPLSSTDEQKAIVDGFDDKYQLNQKLLDGLRVKITSLQSLKASILDTAFKGEL